MTVRIINADVMHGLAQLGDETVQCCVTSPPYFGLRDYGVPGQIGLEPTPDAYVAKMVEVFCEVRRVLRSDGSLWLNIGDSYCNADKWGGGGANTGKHTKDAGGKVPSWGGVRRKWSGPEGIKNKDLMGIPWMLAFALRADGWWLRSANVWAKPNGMPESTRDRPTVGHEMVFQLTKNPTYYYGYDDVKLPAAPESVGRLQRAMRGSLAENGLVMSGGGYAPPGQPPRTEQQAGGAAMRSVWWIAPGGFEEAHFATMPEELAAICVLAGSPVGGTVLDPFSGAGTTALVADRLQRNAIGIELNPEYVAMSEARIGRDRGGLLDMMEGAAPLITQQ